jgi:plastocyanin
MSRTNVALMIICLMVGTVGVASAQDAPSSQTQNETGTTDCAVVIAIDDSGLAYDQTDVSIAVGDTVCWMWENESMEHNVAETSGPSDNNRKLSGVYSGEANQTVDFRHTFNEDKTFYYMCEPHVSMDMRGKITVGNGTPPAVTPEPVDETPNTVPGFGILAVVLAALSAVIMIRVETLRMIRPVAPRIPREV